MKPMFPVLAIIGAVVGGYIGLVRFAPVLMSGNLNLLTFLTSSDPVDVAFKHHLAPPLLISSGLGLVTGCLTALAITVFRKFRKPA